MQWHVGGMFGWLLLEKSGLRRLWHWLLRKPKPYQPLTGPVLLRRAFEALGATFIKLGQMIASGDGLFPPRYSEELRKCLDRVPPFAFADVERTLQDELGADVSQLFASFDQQPLAAASIAQVHAARLRDGSEVVVKVQRPGLHRIVEADLEILAVYARLLALLPLVDLANPRGIVEDLALTLRDELDFRKEASNMDEFNQIMQRVENQRVVAPRVHWELTRARVLTMERFFGVSVDDAATLLALDEHPVNRLLDGIRAWFQCLIARGCFHGDVHAGNFMVLDDGRVGFLDFGIVGRFGPEQRDHITRYVLAFQTRDFAELAEVLVAMGSVAGQAVDRSKLAGELATTFEPMTSQSEQFRLRDIVPGMLRLAVKHRMRMPKEFVLVTKQLVYLDRYARTYGGNQMNVLTDPRVMEFLVADLQRASNESWS